LVPAQSKSKDEDNRPQTPEQPIPDGGKLFNILYKNLKLNSSLFEMLKWIALLILKAPLMLLEGFYEAMQLAILLPLLTMILPVIMT